MPEQRQLSISEAASAAQIQQALDQLAPTGGRLILPSMDLTLDRGLRLHSGVELSGQGAATILRKGPGRVYPLSGYHNYGMCDVPLASTAGLEVGMTVSIHDDRTHGGFYETFATITWIDDGWVGLDHGLEADYRADANPCLTTVYPLVFGHRISHAALRHIHLEGHRSDNDKSMGGCRGGAVYFGNSQDLEITAVTERDYFGEGLSFQMCRQVRIADCQFDDNTGNGLHPGAGSTDALFTNCGGRGNQRSGFFFCVRANHITVRDCRFAANHEGISIGTRDCHNLIEACQLTDNQAAGILVRPTPEPTHVHSCLIRACQLESNAREAGRAQLEITSDARDLMATGNRITGPGTGIWAAETTRNIYLADNTFTDCQPEIDAQPDSLAQTPPKIEYGYDTGVQKRDRHLLFTPA
ncbi:MAG: hypothetical protein GKR89_09070 [Candidatus Latescibacteria bacterium]|nr:hypothetical protein [Candidatus Latescibacterota bacterium]